MRIRHLFERLFRSRVAVVPLSAGSRAWLPSIDTDSCTGCGRCVEVCEAQGLEMVWAFATLTRPEVCTGEGVCARECPEDLIRMAWVSTH